MHATQSEVGGQLDLLSMYLVASFAAAYALMRWLRQGRLFFWQLFSLMVAAASWSGCSATTCRSCSSPATSRSRRCC